MGMSNLDGHHPNKNESYQLGYEQGRTDREKEIIDLIYFFEKTWNKESHKRVPHKAITELVEFIMQNDTSESVERWLKEQE